MRKQRMRTCSMSPVYWRSRGQWWRRRWGTGVPFSGLSPRQIGKLITALW
ncbi:hypothetical protein ABZT06_47045 [Streptomyces sp. NPDC005483]